MGDAVKRYTVRVIMESGVVFEYVVATQKQVREHAAEIIMKGYRHNDGKEFEHYPPHKITKVQCKDFIETDYVDISVRT